MANKDMRRFWNGYRAAKNDYFNGGIDSVIFEFNYGLNGVSQSFYKGYRYFINRYNNR